jgi:hypothetical protein
MMIFHGYGKVSQDIDACRYITFLRVRAPPKKVPDMIENKYNLLINHLTVEIIMNNYTSTQ